MTLFTPASVDVAVYGRPATQGSKTIVVNHGRHVPVEDNPHLKPWRRDVIAAAQQAMCMHDGSLFPLLEPLVVTLTVYVDRPPSNRDPFPTARPYGDIDKLARACLDALTIARMWADDALVVDLHAHKRWTSADRPPGAAIRISPLGGTTP